MMRKGAENNKNFSILLVEAKLLQLQDPSLKHQQEHRQEPFLLSLHLQLRLNPHLQNLLISLFQQRHNHHQPLKHKFQNLSCKMTP